ncbi:MAG: hypothetical protein LC793_06265 [Thermomicrobia bacterium]|nr:hypothetical protein [Thermomicrobia bacterium]
MGDGIFNNEVTRREAMKTALKAGAYATPVILSTTVPSIASAATLPTSGPFNVRIVQVQSGGCGNTEPISYNPFVYVNVRNLPGGAGKTYPVIVETPLDNPGGYAGIGVITLDATGSGNFSGNNYNYFANGGGTVAAYKVSLTTGGTPATAIASATLTASQVTTLSCVPLVTSGPLRAGVIVAPTALSCNGGPAQYIFSVVGALTNAVALGPNAEYTVFVRPNTATSPAGTFTPVLNGSTDPTSSDAFIGPSSNAVATSGPPTSVTLTVVPFGAPATPATYTVTVTVAPFACPTF